MKNRKISTAKRICILAGICLLVGAAFMLGSWQWSIRTAEKESAVLVDAIRSLMPRQQNAVLEERRDNTMAVLSLDGTDFIGILEMPRYGSALPVAADWGEVRQFPCRLAGSIYDGSIQIGGTTQKGQYDFYREISVGDSIFFTDMEGNCYTFSVTDLHYEKHANQAALQRKEAALTLFIKNDYAFEYIIVSCDVLN